MLEEAIGYLGRGWSVVPGHTVGDDGCSCRQLDCDRPGKHPRVRWADFQLRLATENELRYWWTRWPESNVIVITGEISGIVAVDIDPRHGGDEAWAAWCRRAPMPRTPTSLTGGSGQHLIFQHPSLEVRNTINMLSPGKGEDGKARESGVDFRGDGGYIVAPPSRHSSGRTYEWDTDAHIDDLPPPPMPPELIDLVHRRLRMPGSEGMRHQTLNIEGLLMGNETIDSGSRNDTLTRICGYFATQCQSESVLMHLVMSVNEKACDDPLGEREVRRIVHSIYSREHAQQEARKADESELEALVSDPQASQLDVATVLWQQLGVPRITDWVLLRGDSAEYVLTTPEDELHIPDLLDVETMRRILLNHLGVLPSLPVRHGQFDRQALMLRTCAREVVIEESRSEDRIATWVDGYLNKVGARADVPEEQRLLALDSGPLVVDGMIHLRPQRFSLFIESAYGEVIKVPALRRMLIVAGWRPFAPLRSYRQEFSDAS